MWEKTLIESNYSGRRWKRTWSIPVAAGIHAGLIFGALLASYWKVEAVEAPLQPTRYVEAVPIALSPPARGGGKEAKKIKVKKRATRETQPTQIVQLKNENEIPVAAFEPHEEGVDLGDGDGAAGNGIPDGVEGGWGTTPWGEGTVLEETEPVEISSGMTPPVLLRRVEPEYPRAASHARIQGVVIFEAVITKNGDIEEVRTLRTDHVLLEKAAKQAVLQWKYKPAQFQGRPIKVYFTVTCRFYLK